MKFRGLQMMIYMPLGDSCDMTKCVNASQFAELSMFSKNF